MEFCLVPQIPGHLSCPGLHSSLLCGGPNMWVCHRPDVASEFGGAVRTHGLVRQWRPPTPPTLSICSVWELTNEIMYLSIFMILAHSRSQGGLYFFVFSNSCFHQAAYQHSVFTYRQQEGSGQRKDGSVCSCPWVPHKQYFKSK